MNAVYPSAETLMTHARERTGLEDFGATGFREGLERLLESLAADAPYEAADRERALGLIDRRLVNRLEIEAWLSAHPEIETARIEDPISICGLPRTGTTALGNMMSLDPRFRPLRPWEQEIPCPPPRLEDEANDPRRIAYRDRIETMLREDPSQGAMHIWEVDATMEDTEVLGLEFRSQQMTMPVWSYHAWWRSGDLRDTFRAHARIARLLQSERPPNRWLFKAPHHKFHLEHLLAGYPDIRFVFTHRDPAKSVPSYASFIASLFPPYVVERIGKEKIGREIHDHLATGMRQAMAARDRLGPDRFFDVHHSEFVAQPMVVLERLYGWLGLEFDEDVQRRFESWRAEHASGAHGTHRYTAGEFGLSVDAIREEYRDYIQTYDVEVDGRGPSGSQGMKR
jgi:hypothetical protein